MPLDDGFRERAEHNDRFLETLELATSPFLDWAVVVAFYVAVRYVDAYFHPFRPVSHPERLNKVANDSKTRPIFSSYRELYNSSREARYELVVFTEENVRSLIENRLNHVRTHMRRQ